jgi:two-component system, NarL family, nitrate/nitrite response regulator NarL
MSAHLLAEALQRTGGYEAVPAPTPESAFRLLERSQFDVTLVAMESSADLAGNSSFMRELQRLYPTMDLIVLLEMRRRSLVLEALACGARGIFCRADGFEALCNCIRCVHAGQVWACSAELQLAVDALFEHACKVPRISGERPLSKREEQIALLVAEGYSNRQISTRLVLSEHTIKNYLFRIFEKVGVSTRVGLTLHMLKQGTGSQTINSAFEDIPLSGPALVPRHSNP